MVEDFISQFARLDWVSHPIGSDRFEAAAGGGHAEGAARLAANNMS